jgi:serine/threonine-protein kinase
VGVKICPVCHREFAPGVTHCSDDGVPLVALATDAGMRPEDLIGKVVEGRYKIERIIGKGGMGTVYACRHVVVGKIAAMKVLKTGVERSDGVLQRFVREAQTANLLRSRHIVEVSDFGQLPSGAFFVVMELLEGEDLARKMRRGLSRAELVHVFTQVAETLQIAHDKGVVHRDLKPDNVFLVNEAGDPLFVKLLDFGIAKILHGDSPGALTETGVILGTPYYMSPEQARAEAVDHRSDVYSLGVMMYRAFTGRLPFLADSTMGVLTRHITEDPKPPSHLGAVDQATERMILRCMAKRREDRFQSMAELAQTLKLLPVQPVSAIREHTTVNELPLGISPPSGAHAAPSGAYVPAGAQPSGAYAPVQTPSGPYAPVAPQTPSGPYAPVSAQTPSGAYAPVQTPSGPYAPVPMQAPSGAYAPVAAQTPSAVYTPAAAPVAAPYAGPDPRISGAPGTGLPVVPAVVGALPPAPYAGAEGTMTALHVPGVHGMAGADWGPSQPVGGEIATTRGLAATGAVRPPPRGPSTAAILVGAVAMAAVGAVGAFLIYRAAMPPPGPAPAGVPAAASTAAPAAPPPSATPPPATTTAAAPAPSTAPSAVASATPAVPVQQTGHGRPAPRPPPTATATAAAPKKPPTDIRSPFE